MYRDKEILNNPERKFVYQSILVKKSSGKGKAGLLQGQKEG